MIDFRGERVIGLVENPHKYKLSFDPSEPEAYRRDVPKAEVHVVDGGHFALDTAADEIAALVRAFMQ